jgi:hypothetical protein
VSFIYSRDQREERSEQDTRISKKFLTESVYKRRITLEQSPDQQGQAGHAEQQQAGSPQEGQDVIAM